MNDEEPEKADRFADFGPPIPVEGGLVARSTRGFIGEEWWSRRFIDVLESFSLGGRLTRGRAYARKGQVISLDVAPGEVRAEVQGSRVRPYQVRIGLPVFTELLWAKAEVAIAEQAIHAARLLAGQFPPELEPVFAKAGAPFFPARLSDLSLSCSCPDGAIPCKHLAAVFYLLAERFDDDPFQILLLRGRSRGELLARVRRLRGEEEPDPRADDVPPVAPVGAAAALVGLVPVGVTGSSVSDVPGRGASSDPMRFWTAGEPLPVPKHPALPPDLLLRSLPTPGSALGGSRLLAQLAPLYEGLADS
ncbi:SWIM zinc finger family protein [Spongisporangium articulatum]|uniref:SWIM zinc finger family protein n=1 Tax=Spongisporangium articulatum TaxID=3362603 RepID=A0ABW8AMJ0_9ACTN